MRPRQAELSLHSIYITYKQTLLSNPDNIRSLVLNFYGLFVCLFVSV